MVSSNAESGADDSGPIAQDPPHDPQRTKIALSQADLHEERIRRLEAKTDSAALYRDRFIIRAMRMAVFGLGFILVMFAVYIVSSFIISAHDNRRIDELKQRVDHIEHIEHRAEAP